MAETLNGLAAAVQNVTGVWNRYAMEDILSTLSSLSDALSFGKDNQKSNYFFGTLKTKGFCYTLNHSVLSLEILISLWAM